MLVKNERSEVLKKLIPEIFLNDYKTFEKLQPYKEIFSNSNSLFVLRILHKLLKILKRNKNK
jgi:hypothetical protein